MAFTGKATYSGGADLPEIVEDVGDIIGIVSPFETPLLDHLGDPRGVARSTVHEWLEDSLLPNADQINQASFSPSATTATAITVDNGSRFQIGDQVKPGGLAEVMLVTNVVGNVLTVQRGYGGTAPAVLADNMSMLILGNAALEGDVRPAARFTSRVRRQNYTQIFTAGVEVSGSSLATRAIGVADELDWQKQERVRELLRDLENCVINGVAPAATPQGSTTVRRTMRGILASITTNRFQPNAGGIPPGEGGGLNGLNETVLNACLRRVWENASGRLDTIVVGGAQKRKLNAFTAARTGYTPADTRFRELVNVYESDFGVARVILSRWVPPDTMLFLDSARISVLPLTGRSFHFRKHGTTGDAEAGQVIGEYTVEVKNESAHAALTGLSIA